MRGCEFAADGGELRAGAVCHLATLVDRLFDDRAQRPELRDAAADVGEQRGIRGYTDQGAAHALGSPDGAGDLLQVKDRQDLATRRRLRSLADVVRPAEGHIHSHRVEVDRFGRLALAADDRLMVGDRA